MSLPDEVIDLALLSIDALTLEKVTWALEHHPEMDMIGILHVVERLLRQEAKSVAGTLGHTIEEQSRLTALYLTGLARFLERVENGLARGRDRG